MFRLRLFCVPYRHIQGFSNVAERVPMIARTENQLMILACFFAAGHYGHTSASFCFARFDSCRGGFVSPLPTGISAVFDGVGQHDVLRKAGFDPVVRVFALRRSSGFDLG